MNKGASILATALATATPSTSEGVIMDMDGFETVSRGHFCVLSASLPPKYDCHPELAERDGQTATGITNQLVTAITECSGVSIEPRDPQSSSLPSRHFSATPESIHDEACLEATIQELRRNLPLIALSCLISSTPDMENDDERAMSVEIDCSVE